MTKMYGLSWHDIGMVLWFIGTCKSDGKIVFFGDFPRWVPTFFRNVSLVKEWERKC